MPGQSIRRDVNREGRRPLTPLHSIVNDFVGLSCRNPVAFYTFPYDESREATPVDPECAARQMGITSRYRANLDVPPHNHEFYEITVVREGTAVHHTDTADTEVGLPSAVWVTAASIPSDKSPVDLIAIFGAAGVTPKDWLEVDVQLETNISHQGTSISPTVRSLGVAKYCPPVVF